MHKGIILQDLVLRLLGLLGISKLFCSIYIRFQVKYENEQNRF